MNLIKVGKLIAKIRKEKNMTQDELAEKFGISGKSVSKWERGINAPDISLLEALSQELGITVNELLSGEKNTNENIENDKITIDSINYYNNIQKHKNLIIIVIIVMLLTFIFSLIFTINNFNKCSIYSIDGDNSELMIDGFIIFNQNEKIIIINDIKYYNQYEKTDYEIKGKNVDLKLVSNDKVIFYLFDEENSSELKSLSSILDNISLSITDKNDNSQNIITKDDMDELYLLINFDDDNDDRKSMKFKLNYKKEFSNNKLFY